MKKLIEIPEDIRWKLEELALKDRKPLKTFIEDLLIKVATAPSTKG